MRRGDHDSLGGLPLALEEAAAYVEATGQSFAGYLQNYRKQFAALAGDDAFRPGTYPNTVLTTWGVSWAAATQENPGAADLLRLFAFYAPEDIPRALLTTQAEKLPHPLARGLAEGVAFDKAAAALVRYSLIKATPDSFAVHRLVQAVTRARVSDPLPWADAAIALVNAAFPDHSGDVRFWPACARLRPHAEAALAAAQDLPTNAAHTSRLLDRLAFYLYSQGLYPAAQPLFERALAIREQALGPKHPDVAESLNNLAALYRDQGHYNEAELLLQRALAIWEQALGPEHPDVATGLCGLAELYHAQGRYGEAAPLCERALAILEKALGPEHPAMATYLNNLATLYRDQGRYGEAAPLCHRALAIWEQALGPEHPDVATYLNNLAVIHSGQGHYSEAAPLYQRALAIREQALGPEHPDVATGLCGLAELYANQGHSGEAEPLYQRALAIREQALGPKHLKTIETRSALSVLAVVQTKAPQDGDP